MGAGGAMKYRHLGRKSSHRQALLRNLVTSLFEHESISTTWPKAKEAQRLAEKMITLGKRNTETARRSAMSVFYDNPTALLPKLFGDLRRRYQNRPGGYTRVLRIEPLKTDQAPSAILELVDGPKDIRFAMTAATLAREREADVGMREITSMNVKKVTQFRKGGEAELEKMVASISKKRGIAVRPKREEKDGVVEAEEEEVEVMGKYQGSYGRHVGNRRPQPRWIEEPSASILDMTDKNTAKENSREFSHPAKLSR